ncbi:MAG TPA: TRAP transporter substrate-binding protein DctP [Woeseiaceae bacterium]|jgi:TRAP-type mannitol/chloroaromatic compound transport system substrate-binding protein|nr:TRAP transporter substrate-binding protein DctP [Woeseiaceae bacterium]
MIKRRNFLGGAALAAGAAACGRQRESAGDAANHYDETFEWNMVTSWPPGLPGAGAGAANLAKRVERASNGRLRIKVFAGGELVPALEVFAAVSGGTVQMGHDASYYHRGKVPAAQYFTTAPFGLNGNEMNAWLYYGGGLGLWRELYAPFDLVPFPAGQTGVQMAGWFNREIDSVADLEGLKMRIPGMGGEVMQRAGVQQVTVPGSEIFTSLQTGVIDAAEWIGPYNDLSLGLHKAARYYYYPGWHEPGSVLQCIVNKNAWDSLPEDLQEIVASVSQAVNLDMQAEYNYGNAMALDQLSKNPDVEIRPLPDDVLALLHRITLEVSDELSRRNENARRIQQSFYAFLEKSAANQRISEQAFLNKRDIAPGSG